MDNLCLKRYINTIVHDYEHLLDFLLLHELYISTKNLIRYLLKIYKKTYKVDECPIKNIFTFILEHSTHQFTMERIKDLSKRVKKFDEEDAMNLKELWIRKELNCVCEPKGLLTQSSKIRSASAILSGKSILPIALRNSTKSIIHFSRIAYHDDFVINKHNINEYLITSALTRIDQLFFQKLKVSDLKNLRRTGNNKKDVKLVSLIVKQHEGVLNLFINYLKCADNKRDAIIKLLRVSKHLKKQRNFHSLAAIIGALNKVKKEEWEQVPEYLRNYFKSLDDIYDPNKNYKNYRQYVEFYKNIIQCFSIFSRDVFLLFEHNALFLTNKKGTKTINSDFIRWLSRSYHDFKKCEEVKLIGKLDENILNKLSFAHVKELEE